MNNMKNYFKTVVDLTIILINYKKIYMYVAIFNTKE